MIGIPHIRCIIGSVGPSCGLLSFQDSSLTLVGDTIQCYLLESSPIAQTLNSGDLSGSWGFVPDTLGLWVIDDIQSYEEEDPIVQTLDGGVGSIAPDWPAGEWTFVPDTLGLQWFDDIQLYIVEDPVTQELDAGTEYLSSVPIGEWTIFEPAFLSSAEDSLDYSDQAFNDVSMNGGTGYSSAWESLYYLLTPPASWGTVLFWFRGDKHLGVNDDRVKVIPSSASGTPQILSTDYNSSTKWPQLKTNVQNSLSVIRFDGGDMMVNRPTVATGYFAANSLTIPTSYAIYAVLKLTTSSGYKRAIHVKFDGDAVGFFGVNGDNFATFFGNGSSWNDTTANSPNTALTSSFHLAEVRNNGSVATPAVDSGSDQTTKTGTTVSAVGFIVGSGSISAFTQAWIGDIAEFIITEDIGTTARDAIRAELETRWGI